MKLGILALTTMLAAGLALAGCDALGLKNDSKVSVSFTVPRSSTASNASFAVLADPITVNGHTLDVQNADVTFSKIKLDRDDTNSSSTSSDEDSDSDDSAEDEDIRLGPTTVALPLAGGMVTFSETIPPGDYESVELGVTSVRLRGTYDGQTFDVTVPVHAEIEQDLSPAFHVGSDADKLNVTITVNVADWLKNSDGSLIDPRQLATNGSLRSQVINRIRASFRSFEDSDRDADEADSDSDSH
jgi:hypothetical protein